ncbi:hypothetical protein [Streptomyces sp. NPDC088137]|uniref:hypothetical protein n=1 Tax=Streptomyces sp. NPDC088137 TaxID=3365827 RepID=UPI003824C832
MPATGIFSAAALLVITFMDRPHRALVLWLLVISAAFLITGGHLPELPPDVLSGALDPGRDFGRAVPLTQVPDGYWAMNDRSAPKVRIAF